MSKPIATNAAKNTLHPTMAATALQSSVLRAYHGRMFRRTSAWPFGWTALAARACSIVACSAAVEPPKAPQEQPKATEVAPAPAADVSNESPVVQAESGLPARCDKGSTARVCLPPEYLARALCNQDFPTVALAMFAKDTPWTRAYSRTTQAAWNASGGSSSNDPMLLDEEVIVLKVREPNSPGGIQVSGAGASYDVLRWDGECVTLEDGLLAFQRPPRVTNARIVFKRLEMHVREALKDAPALEKLHREWRKECKGVTMGEVSKACERLDGQFSGAIASYVREKGGVPAPKKLPNSR